jgi:hypothetical protein
VLKKKQGEEESGRDIDTAAGTELFNSPQTVKCEILIIFQICQ